MELVARCLNTGPASTTVSGEKAEVNAPKLKGPAGSGEA
jgi:hypothetical protein